MYCIPEKENSLAAYKDKFASFQQDHPEWEPHELRVHTAQDLLPKFLAEQVTVKRENRGLQIYEVPEAAFTVDDAGLVWYPKYGMGVGLVDLSERQKRLMPEKYSPEEHATSLLIQNQFQEGATIVTTSYGGRDIVIMEYDPITKVGKTTMINTAVTQEAQGKTIQAFMQEYFPVLASVFVTNNVFIFSDKELSVSRANEIVRPVLKDIVTAPKKQFVQSNQQKYRIEQERDRAYIPLPFVSFTATDVRDVVVENTGSEPYSVPFIVGQGETHQQVAVNEEMIKNTKIEEEEPQVLKIVEVEDTHVSQQEKTSVVTVLFQYKETHEQSDQIEPTMLQPLYDSVPSESTKAEIVYDAVIMQEVQNADMKLQEEYVGDWRPSVQEFQSEVSQLVTDVPPYMKEIQSEHIEAVQYEDSEENIVVQKTLEEYFLAGVQESVVEIEPAEVYQLFANPVKEEVQTQEKAPKDAKKVRKLCWILPLTEATERPEMFEVEMPKDQNQRIHNLLHFLRKVIKQQFGTDTILHRQMQVIQTDVREENLEEIEYYLSLLERKHMRRHMYAMVS
ncbi:MAG: hypothetical protein WAV51_04310 [Microgenomates group bacterium]